MLGDGVVVHAGGEQHGDLHFPGGREIDLVEPDAILGNDPELRRAFFQDRTGDRVVAAEEGIELLLRKL